MTDERNGLFGRMEAGQGDLNTWRYPASVPLFGCYNVCLNSEVSTSSSFFRLSGWGETGESTWYVGLLYQPRMIDDDDYGAVGGMRIGRGNRSTRKKPAPVPLCPPQIPYDLTRDRPRAAAVGSQRLTA
jgi:hypothetical protein